MASQRREVVPRRTPTSHLRRTRSPSTTASRWASSFFHLLEFSTPGWNNRDHSCEAPTKAGWGSEAVKPGMRYLYHNYSQLTNFYEQEEINKRLSLPADLKLPDNFITRQTASPTLEGPITRYEKDAFLQHSMNTIHPPLLVICWPGKNAV